MKTYKIYFEYNYNICGWVDANNPVNALMKFYTYVNSIAGGQKNLCYTAEIDITKNITL